MTKLKEVLAPVKTESIEDEYYFEVQLGDLFKKIATGQLYTLLYYGENRIGDAKEYLLCNLDCYYLLRLDGPAIIPKGILLDKVSNVWNLDSRLWSKV